MPKRSNSIPPLEPEALLGAIVASSQDAIISKDLNGIVTSWNPAAEQIFGYTAREMIGQSIRRLIPPDRIGDEDEILAQIRRGQRIEHYETIRKRKDGTRIDVSLTVSPIRDRAGKVIGASKIARDISAARHAQADLRRSEEQFRVTLDSIGDAVIATDVDGRITFMNPVAESLTGWAERDAKGLLLPEVLRIVNELTRETVEDPVTRVLREGHTIGLANHTMLIARNGSERPISDSAAPIRDADQKLIGVVMVFRDDSDERAAKIADQRLAAIVEGSDDAIIGKDLEGRVTSWNDGAEQMFGYTAAEMIGESITRLFPADHQGEEPAILAQLQQDKRVTHFETVRVRKDGSRIDVSLTISPIKDYEGRIIGASKIARDITPQKQFQHALETARTQLAAHAQELENKVRDRTAQLEETVAQLNTFSYSLSHDMRAPLRSIQGFAEMVATDYADKLGPEGVNHLRRIISAAVRLDRLIHDVLSFSRVSRQELAVERVDLDQLVRDLVAERADLQQPKAEVTIEGRLAPVQGQVAFLTQCVSNLLENAVKFVAPGTRPHVNVRTERRNEHVRLWIEDNGIGIAPALQPKLFHLFERGHADADYPGTGVGLAIVRKAVERMNGATGVDSVPGKGSRFWIELPVAK